MCSGFRDQHQGPSVEKIAPAWLQGLFNIIWTPKVFSRQEIYLLSWKFQSTITIFIVSCILL